MEKIYQTNHRHSRLIHNAWMSGKDWAASEGQKSVETYILDFVDKHGDISPGCAISGIAAGLDHPSLYEHICGLSERHPQIGEHMLLVLETISAGAHGDSESYRTVMKIRQQFDRLVKQHHPELTHK